MEKKKWELKDLVSLLTLVFFAGGMYYKINLLERDMDSIKKANIELLYYRVGKIEYKVDQVMDKLKKPYDE